MDTIKSSPEAMLTFGVIEALGAINPQLARTMVDFFSAKGVGVTTNVPGPRQPRWFAGVPVTGVLGWAPSAGIQTLNECIFSYDGTIRVGFKADRENVPDPHDLVRAFDMELLELTHI
jgi:diacylglycerol O-acyltransferase